MALDEALLTFLRNFINLLPFEIVHTYQQGVKFSFGQDTRLLNQPGLYWHWPIVQSIEVESTASRFVETQYQDLTTSDDKPVTVSASVGYTITDVRKYWVNLQEHGESIANLAGGVIAGAIMSSELDEVKKDVSRKGNGMSKLEEKIFSGLKEKTDPFGVEIEYFALANFAVAQKTYRLVGSRGSSNLVEEDEE